MALRNTATFASVCCTLATGPSRDRIHQLSNDGVQLYQSVRSWHVQPLFALWWGEFSWTYGQKYRGMLYVPKFVTGLVARMGCCLDKAIILWEYLGVLYYSLTLLFDIVPFYWQWFVGLSHHRSAARIILLLIIRAYCYFPCYWFFTYDETLQYSEFW